MNRLRHQLTWGAILLIVVPATLSAGTVILRRKGGRPTSVVQSKTTENKSLVRLPAPAEKQLVRLPAVTAPPKIRLLPPVANSVQPRPDVIESGLNRTHVRMQIAPPSELAPQLGKTEAPELGRPQSVPTAEELLREPQQSGPPHQAQVQLDPVQGHAIRRLPQVETQGSVDYWWERQVQVPLRNHQHHLNIDVQKLVFDALNHSLKLKADQEPILIRADDIIRAEAEFDATAYVESKFVDTNEPVGNTLVTGGPPRLNEHDWNFEAGIRKKTTSGARITASQRMGHKNNNSVFFTPQDQGTAQLSLGVTQPLLNGAGNAYNTSMIVLAELNTQIADDQFRRNLQDHLLEVANVYWQLYTERSMMLQQQRHLARAQDILTVLENRIALDALQSQIVRARSAVASRQAELERAEFTIRNIESRIRTLVNSPDLARGRMPELVTRELPIRTYLPVNLDAAVQTALTHRPEMDEAMQRIRAATVRLDVSKNEWLPALSLVLETYVTGLQGNSNIGGALQRQLDTGSPSYTAGLVFETPIYNRAASARVRQRQRELRQMTLEFEHTTQILVEEVEVAVRDTTAAFREMRSKETAMLASKHETDYLLKRWEMLPGTDRSASLLLEDIFNAQERLMEEETSLVKAQVDYVKALTELKRVTGTMVCIDQSLPLQHSNVIDQP